MTIIYEFMGDETPAGVIDGKNAVFTLSKTPNPGAGLQLFRNGMRQKRGPDYLLAGMTITFVPANIPIPGDVLIADYRF